MNTSALLRSTFVHGRYDKNGEEYLNLRYFAASGLGEFLEVPEDQQIWSWISNHAQKYGEAPASSTLRTLAKSKGEDATLSRIGILEGHNYLRHGDFRFSADMKMGDHRHRKVVEVIKEAGAILTGGLEVQRGQNKVRIEGPEQALQHVYERGREALRQTGGTEASGGHLRAVAGDVWTNYKKVEADPSLLTGAKSGFTLIDEATDGLRPGELCIHAGFAKAGKSTFALNWAYHLAIREAQDVVFVSLEMPSEQLGRYLVALHSWNPFHDDIRDAYKIPRGEGIPYRAIRQGTVDEWHPKGRDFLNCVAEDLADDPQYGRLIIETPEEATVAAIRQRAEFLADGKDLALLVIDYGQLLDPRRWSTSTTQNQNEIVRDLKRLALGFRQGRGVPVLTPWQISREGHRAAEIRKQKGVPSLYSGHSLSWAHEAERSADLVTASFVDDDLRQRGLIHIECILSREETFSPFLCPVDWASRYIDGQHPGQTDYGSPSSNNRPVVDESEEIQRAIDDLDE
ncbi:MAG: AAA family ATPase [Deltaproteobacteria bacterium]|nr:AAA family ATPase [Deltaproteobacteria bacterium]